MIKVRFAPSPTGPLHIGGARTALFNYLFARKTGGRFLLRIDDTDTERSEKRFEDDILTGLRWLGLEWDEAAPGKEFVRQSERIDRYAAAIEELKTKKAVEPAEGGALRMAYPGRQIIIEDLICGDAHFNPDSLGPAPILVRSDGRPTYHLASVVDDIDLGVTHVIRGQDHLTNTAKHKVLFEALGHQPPAFAHLPLILGSDGAKLSKRSSESLTSVTEFREAGYLPEALVNFIALLGWSHPEAKESFLLEDLISAFSLERVGRTGSIFEQKKLDWLNGYWTRHLPVEQIADEALRFTGEYRPLVQSAGKSWWQRTVAELRDGFVTLKDAEHTCRLLFAYELPLNDEAAKTIGEAKELYRGLILEWQKILSDTATPDGSPSYAADQISQFINRLKKAAGGDKKAAFHAVRIAATGALSGPELKVLLPLLSREILVSRAEAVLKLLE